MEASCCSIASVELLERGARQPVGGRLYLAIGPLWFLRKRFSGRGLFFVLSGFIIAMSSRSLVDRGLGWRDYLKTRFVRIYVPYWPVGLAMLVLYVAFPSLSQGDRTPGFWTSVTLLLGVAPPALSVAWTLVHEMVFYPVYLLWFFRKRAFWWLMAIWTVAIAGQFFFGGALERVERYLLSPLNLYFLLGILTFRLSQRVAISRGAALGLLGAALLTVAAMGSVGNPDRGWIGLAFAGAVLAFTSPWLRQRRVPWLLVTLGTASYSIYLVHNPALSAAMRMLKYAAPSLSAVVALWVISLASLAVGLAYWWICERNALRVVRRVLRHGQQAR